MLFIYPTHSKTNCSSDTLCLFRRLLFSFGVLEAYSVFLFKYPLERFESVHFTIIDFEQESEIVIINRLFPDAVLCMETALFYYSYSDRNPAEWNFAIDKNVSNLRTKIDYPFIKAYRVEPALVTLGETSGKIDSIDVRIYDRDRTICDVLRNMNKMDREIFNKAIQGYVKDPKKNVPNLMSYAIPA